MRVSSRPTSATSIRLFGAALAVTAAFTGCTQSAAVHGASLTPPRTAAPILTSTATTDAVSGYVNAVNGLCAQTKDAVRKMVPNGYGPDTPVATYRAQAAALRAIYRAFDARFAALPVPAAAAEASAAFRGYVTESDREKQQLLAAAASGSQSKFAALMNSLTALDAGSPVMSRRDAAGFSSDCNYR